MATHGCITQVGLEGNRRATRLNRLRLAVFRCSRLSPVSGALQNPQNWKPSGFSLPHAGQAAIARVYDDQWKAWPLALSARALEDWSSGRSARSVDPQCGDAGWLVGGDTRGGPAGGALPCRGSG
jgi:hypothetical protein